MGLFSKIKSIFGKKEEQAKELTEEEKIEVYEEPEETKEEPEVIEKPKKEKKSIFKKKEKISKEEKIDIIETEKYVEGLSKSRDNFVNKLSVLGIKYTKVSDEFYDELEEILITADIGVNTVMDFVDRLKKRVKEEHIEDFDYLKEVIVD